MGTAAVLVLDRSVGGSCQTTLSAPRRVLILQGQAATTGALYGRAVASVLQASARAGLAWESGGQRASR